MLTIKYCQNTGDQTLFMRYNFMKPKIKNFLSDYTLVSFLFTIYIVVSLIQWYLYVVEKEVHAVACREMIENVQQFEIMMENIVDESIDDLSLLAKYIAKSNTEDENIVDFLKCQSQIEEFDNLYYIRLNGKGINLNNNQYDFSQNTTFIKALDSNFSISDPHISVNTGEFVFDIAVPVIKDDKTIAVLISETSMKNISAIIEQVIKKASWAFLLDQSLNIIYTNSENHKNSSTISELDLKKMGSQNVEIAKQNFISGQSGSFMYEADGKKKIMVYIPISLTTWAIAVTIPVDHVANDLNVAINHITSISVIIIFILVSLIITTWYIKSSLLHSVEKNAYYDPLTGLPNLLKIKLDMKNILENNKDKLYTIVKCDIENFKTINEMYGFETGNKVLQAFKILQDRLENQGVIVARVGIDEFLIFASDGFLDDIETKKTFYERYHKQLIPEIEKYSLVFKYGRYHIEPDETNVDKIVSRVSHAHKMAKESKDVSLCDYDSFFIKKLMREAEITNKKETAIENEDFKVYLQPKFCVESEKLVGAEALVRWIEGNGAIIYPDEFIPLFEKNRFIMQLDKYMVEKTCQIIQSWISSNKQIIPISINCSRINLSNPDYLNNLVEITDKYNIPHEYIDIELTESIMLGNEDLLDKLLKDLQQFGFKNSIDDFGAGYSSLGLLKNLNINTLKLDRSFFGNSKDIERSNKVVEGIIQLAHSLDINVVAEGIETSEQFLSMKAVKCDAVQGYYFAKPMPAIEFEAKYLASTYFSK